VRALRPNGATWSSSRHLFDWLVTGHVLHTNPASFVRGPKFSYTKGKTPILTPTEARRLIRLIPTDTLVGLRDRALIGLMIYTFARVSAAITMNVKDVYRKQETLWVRLHEKGGKHHEMPCQYNLKEWLQAYIDAAGLAEDPNGPLFRSVDRKTKHLGNNRLDRQRAWAMVKRRASEAGIDTTGICNHTFRGTGITAYLKNPKAKLEHAQQMAAHRTRRRHGSMIAAAIRCHSMRSSGLGSECRLSGPFDAGLAWKTEKAGEG